MLLESHFCMDLLDGSNILIVKKSLCTQKRCCKMGKKKRKEKVTLSKNKNINVKLFFIN